MSILSQRYQEGYHLETGLPIEFVREVGDRVDADPVLCAVWDGVKTINEHLENYLPSDMDEDLAEALEGFIRDWLESKEEVSEAA